MNNRGKIEKDQGQYLIDISDDDVRQAMKKLGGYIDITFGDFKELYHFACSHALNRLMHSATAGDVMTAKVISVHRQAQSVDIADVMARHNVSGVPVLDDKDQVVGIISENDFLSRMGNSEVTSFMSIVARCLQQKGCLAIPISKQQAEDIMTSPVVTVSKDTPVSEIVQIFSEKQINRVPVTGADGQLIGIVSRADTLQTVIPRVKG
ncbi:MAG TPA: CBS domain-containing protein [Desulfobulbus sp.]|nr:CBS domain-containing protein [Desulfobulbus sp.]